MTQRLTAEDLFPLVMKLSPGERCRLLQQTIEQCLNDAKNLAVEPPNNFDLSTIDELLSWDTENEDKVKFFRRE
jgi:hypothetical protein